MPINFRTKFSGIPYVVTFSAVAVTAAQDLFEINVSSTKRVAIKEIRLGQYSDFADAQAEILSVTFVRGYTVSGSGGSAFTPLPLRANDGACSATAEINNTTVANTGTAEVIYADAWNVQAPFLWLPPDDTQIIMEVSTRFVVRITAPADSLTMNGMLKFEEVR